MVDVLALLLFDLCFVCCLNEFLKYIFSPVEKQQQQVRRASVSL